MAQGRLTHGREICLFFKTGCEHLSSAFCLKDNPEFRSARLLLAVCQEVAPVIQLDGSQGEGGGQILRSSLALSILNGRPFKMINIRANRNPSGLRPSHVMSVKAAAELCRARYKGGSVGSSTLYFEPGEVKQGKFHFSIGTAGATGLVLQTIYLPLALRGTEISDVTITGGTHVSTSPCFHYLATTWAAYLRKIGIQIDLEMIRPGFYPRGGGEIRAQIHPCSRIRGFRMMTCPSLNTAGGISAVAGLPESIAHRQARRLSERLKREEIESHIEEQVWDGGPGTFIASIFRQTAVPTLFFSIGERGRPAEAVADAAAEQAIAFRNTGKPVDPHAADQLVLPLALSEDASEFETSEITRHLTTNISVIQQFVDREIVCEGEEGAPGIVRIPAKV